MFAFVALLALLGTPQPARSQSPSPAPAIAGNAAVAGVLREHLADPDPLEFGAAELELGAYSASLLLRSPEGDASSWFSRAIPGPTAVSQRAGVFRCRYHEWLVTTLPTVDGARLCESVRVLAHLDGVSRLVLAEIALNARADIDDALLFADEERYGMPASGDAARPRRVDEPLDDTTVTALLDGPLSDSYVTVAANAVIDHPPMAAPPSPTPRPIPLPEMLRNTPVLNPAPADTPAAPLVAVGLDAAESDPSGGAFAAVYRREFVPLSPLLLAHGEGAPVILVPEAADDETLLAAMLDICLTAPGDRYPPVHAGILRSPLPPIRPR